jgi:hypothetical protein
MTYQPSHSSISIIVLNEMLICIVAIQVFDKGFPLHQVGLDWGWQQYGSY